MGFAGRNSWSTAVKYTPEEIAELLKDKPHQPHYIAAMVKKAIEVDRLARAPVSGDATAVVVPIEMVKEILVALNGWNGPLHFRLASMVAASELQAPSAPNPTPGK